MKKQEKGKRYTNRANIWLGMMTKDIMQEMAKTGFNGKRLGEARYIYKKMLEDKNCVKIMSAAGALVAAGMRNIFVKAITNGLVDVFVATGGSILTHDLIEAFGIRHEQGTDKIDDVKLMKKGIDRIHDVLLPNKGYVIVEQELRKILPLLPQERMAPSTFLRHLGKHIKDENSIIRACYEKNVPIFCPSITDSILGFQLWMYSQHHDLRVDSQLDIKEFLDLTWKKKHYGLIVLGGGVPKHFVAGMLPVTGNTLNYAIQITSDVPQFGGLSGATLQEAKSWGKVAPDALITDIICDATIAFPLLISSLL